MEYTAARLTVNGKNNFLVKGAGVRLDLHPKNTPRAKNTIKKGYNN